MKYIFLSSVDYLLYAVIEIDGVDIVGVVVVLVYLYLVDNYRQWKYDNHCAGDYFLHFDEYVDARYSDVQSVDDFALYFDSLHDDDGDRDDDDGGRGDCALDVDPQKFLSELCHDVLRVAEVPDVDDGDDDVDEVPEVDVAFPDDVHIFLYFSLDHI
ncbi:unnamed protein product [Trichobilharzia regenti]|nr:unnamed protein product [Trichobilharzia regenti]